MPGPELLVPFFIASAVFACVPGPGMLYAAAQTMALGRRAGWLSALGFHLAGFVHIAAAAFGLAVLLAAIPPLFTAVKLAGAAYLIWLGVKHLRSPAAVEPRPVSAAKAPARALRDAVVVEVLNPKSVLFHLAFLPQFTDPSAALPVWAQVLILGAVVNVMFTATDAVCIELSEVTMRRLRASRRLVAVARRVGGGLLVALGVNLALSRQ